MFILGLYIGTLQNPSQAPAWFMQAIDSLEITQGDGGDDGDYQQGFSLKLRADRAKSTNTDYELLTNTLVNVGNRLIVTITFDAFPRVLFDGIIGHRQLSGIGSSQIITLMGKDISILMDLEDKDVDYRGLGDKEIVDQILGKYTSYGISPQVSTPIQTWTSAENERFAKQRSTDRKYLQDLAHRHGSIFRIKPGKAPKQPIAYWGPLDYSDSPQKALTLNSGAATNAELSFSEDALAGIKVLGNVLPSGQEKTTAINVQKNSQKESLAKKTELALSPTFVRTLRLVYSGSSLPEAQSIAQAMVNRSVEQALTVTGSLNVFRYGELLTAPGKVTVRGAGTNYDGEYYVRTVTHLISRNQYQQKFTLTREGVGTTIQKVKS